MFPHDGAKPPQYSPRRVQYLIELERSLLDLRVGGLCRKGELPGSFIGSPIPYVAPRTTGSADVFHIGHNSNPRVNRVVDQKRRRALSTDTHCEWTQKRYYHPSEKFPNGAGLPSVPVSWGVILNSTGLSSPGNGHFGLLWHVFLPVVAARRPFNYVRS